MRYEIATKTLEKIKHQYEENAFKKETYERMRKVKKLNTLNHAPKIAVRAIFLILISFVFVVINKIKCKDFNAYDETYESKFLTNFTQRLSSSNISVVLRIPLCSCLYSDGYFLTKYSEYYWLCLTTIYCYFAAEFGITYRQIENYIWFEKFKIEKFNFSSLKKPKQILRIIIFIPFYIIGILIFLLIVLAYLFCISLLFELFNSYILTGNSFKFPEFITKNTSLNLDNYPQFFRVFFQMFLFRKEIPFIIQSSLIIAVYFLQKRLQLFGLFGAVVIEHNSTLKKFIKYGAIYRLVILPLSNSINSSSLPVFVENSLVAQKVSDLDSETKKLFVDELKFYIFESLTYFTWLLYFIYSYIFFIICSFLFEILKLIIKEKDEKKKIPLNVSLEVAKIRQYLIKYYWDFPWWLKLAKCFQAKSIRVILNNIIMFIIRLFIDELLLRIMKKTKVDIAVQLIHRRMKPDLFSKLKAKKKNN
jgi:hypothetical protein